MWPLVDTFDNHYVYLNLTVFSKLKDSSGCGHILPNKSDATKLECCNGILDTDIKSLLQLRVNTYVNLAAVKSTAINVYERTALIIQEYQGNKVGFMIYLSSDTII